VTEKPTCEELEQRIRELEQEAAEGRRARAELSESEERYRLLVENANEAILVIQDTAAKFVNSRAIAAFGYSEEEFRSISILDLVHPEDRGLVTERYLQKIGGDPTPTRYIYRTIHKNGETQWIENSSVMIRWEGRPATLNLVTNITDRKRMEEALIESERKFRELSIIDDLTQLYNSRHFHNQLKMEIDRADRYGQPLAMLFLDLDDFKRFNDTYGHVEGDRVLSLLGQVITGQLRQTDSAYRYGGEEFIILLPLTAGRDGAVTAERIRVEFKQRAITPATGGDVHMTVSIGVAQYRPGEDMKAFVSRADRLMYQAKKSGKDRVCSES
jgi:diguanylate cyclase (GGDEF)-like protein/PAS domain S-box-containing protein